MVSHGIAQRGHEAATTPQPDQLRGRDLLVHWKWLLGCKTSHVAMLNAVVWGFVLKSLPGRVGGSLLNTVSMGEEK